MARYLRKVLRIRAEDSPNVRLGIAQLHAGKTPTNEMLIPGVLSYAEYRKRRRMWDKVKQSVGLDATFWEGAEVLMFPPAWLDRAEQIADVLVGKLRQALSIGIDPGEGTANTAMTATDRLGIIKKISHKTPDTSVIIGRIIAFGRELKVPPDCWIFDRGGGGKQLADMLRSMGYPVRTVAFGGAVSPDPRRGRVRLNTRRFEREENYAYYNRRAEMYDILRNLLDPAGGNPLGFGIPASLADVRSQLAPVPLVYDNEGRMRLPPKTKRAGSKVTEKSLEEIIGHSPDEADSLVLSVYGWSRKETRKKAGAR